MSAIRGQRLLSNFKSGFLLFLAFASLSFGQSQWAVGTFEELYSITYTESLSGNQAGRFVAVGIVGEIFTSPDAISWTSQTIPALGFPTGKYFMSIKDDNDRSLTSTFILAK